MQKRSCFPHFAIGRSRLRCGCGPLPLLDQRVGLPEERISVVERKVLDKGR